MNVFFDSEFTTLEKGGVRTLISLGFVSQGGAEFYAEPSDTWHLRDCSEFVVATVFPLLQGGDCRMTEAELAVRLKDWIEGLTDQEVILRSDSPAVDWPWIEQLFRFYKCWPKNMRQRCGAIYFEEYRQQHRYNAGLENYWKTFAGQQHHALVDAKSLLFAWKFAIKRGV